MGKRWAAWVRVAALVALPWLRACAWSSKSRAALSQWTNSVNHVFVLSPTHHSPESPPTVAAGDVMTINTCRRMWRYGVAELIGIDAYFVFV